MAVETTLPDYDEYEVRIFDVRSHSIWTRATSKPVATCRSRRVIRSGFSRLRKTIPKESLFFLSRTCGVAPVIRYGHDHA